jgi:LPS export ABC transporter protein LptC
MRSLFLLIPVALIIGALLLSFHEEPARAPAAPTQEPPRYTVTDAHWLRLGSDGEPEFRAQAASLEYFADESVKLREVRLDALGGLSSPWHVEAPRGNAPPRERRLRLTGGVTATGALANENVALQTPRLWVDLLRRELHTDAPVDVRSDFRSVKARGLRTDFAGEHVQLLNDVRVDYAPEG